MSKPKDCYCNRKYTWLRVAIWEAYDYKDAYSREPISFREMEIDHIVPQGLFRDPERLKLELNKLNLPEDFKKDDLLNYAPTYRGINLEKGDKILELTSWYLNKAKEKKEIIIKRIDELCQYVDVVEAAAKIAANIENEQQRLDVIDIILHDVEDFLVETSILNSEHNADLPSVFKKTTKNLWLSGNLPTFEKPTPPCMVGFRTLFCVE